MRALCVVALSILCARPAQASSLTIENLWSLPATFISLWTDTGIQLITADYGIKAPDHLDVPISTATPLNPFASFTMALPDLFASGLGFGSLDMSGPCPDFCSWSSGQTDIARGAWIDDTFPISLLWASQDGGTVPIMRVSFTPSAETPTVPTPEPAVWMLLIVGIIIGSIHHARRAVHVPKA